MEPLGSQGLGNTESSMHSEVYLRSQETEFRTLAAQKIKKGDLDKIKEYQGWKHLSDLPKTKPFLRRLKTQHRRRPKKGGDQEGVN